MNVCTVCNEPSTPIIISHWHWKWHQQKKFFSAIFRISIIISKSHGKSFRNHDSSKPEKIARNSRFQVENYTSEIARFILLSARNRLVTSPEWPEKPRVNYSFITVNYSFITFYNRMHPLLRYINLLHEFRDKNLCLDL